VDAPVDAPSRFGTPNRGPRRLALCRPRSTTRRPNGVGKNVSGSDWLALRKFDQIDTQAVPPPAPPRARKYRLHNAVDDDIAEKTKAYKAYGTTVTGGGARRTHVEAVYRENRHAVIKSRLFI